MKTCIDHQVMGRVVVTLRANARYLRAGWKDGVLHVSAPARAGAEQIKRFLDEHAAPILALRHKEPSGPSFPVGRRLELDGLVIEIAASERDDCSVRALLAAPGVRIEVGRRVDPTGGEGAATVARVIKKVAAWHAPRLLLPRAREIAASTGFGPVEWKISRGEKRLGYCNVRQRTIALSSTLVFFPREQRDLVTLHELAHLCVPDHSPRFHELVGRLTGGREKELEAALRARLRRVLAFDI